MNKTKKKALIVAYNDLNNSGVPNVIFQVISSLHTEYEFDIVVFGDDNFYFKKLLDKGINPKIYKFDVNSKNKRNHGPIYHFFEYPRIMYNQSKEIMSKNKYDVIHSFKEYYSWPFLKAAKKCGIKKRIIHSNVDNSRKVSFAFKILNKRNKTRTLRYATDCVGVSKLCCEHSFGKRNFVILHNSYDENIFNNNLVFCGANNCLTLAQIGSLNSNKNQLFSIQIAQALKQKGVNIKLELVGKETEIGYKEEIVKHINNSSLENDVKIIENCNSIKTIYEKCNYVLLPSKSEGASIVAIEAQACGIKVFATSNIPSDMNVGGIVVLGSKTSPEIWANAIIQEYRNGHPREKYDLSDFSKKNFESKLLQIYKN